MTIIKKGSGWGVRLMVVLPCGHEVEVLREHVEADGRFSGRLGCSHCRRVFDDVVLQGWGS